MQLEHRMERTESVEPADAETIGWFAARQPAVVRFLEDHLWRPDGDAFAVGLDAACRLFRVCAATEGAPSPRLGRAALATGLASMAEGAAGSPRVRELLAWVDGHLDDPPIPLTTRELAEVTLGLHALVFAIDAVLGDRDDDGILY
jgi:hypothetical protein